MMGEKGNAAAKLGASVIMRPSLKEVIDFASFRFNWKLYREGRLIWEDETHNLITTVGGNDLLDKYFAGSAYTAAFKLGLKGAGTPASGDTLASHATWSELTPYSGNRPSISWSSASARSKAFTVNITINATSTVSGGFITDQATGTAGLLYSASDFTAGARSVLSGDTLAVAGSVGV